MEHENYDLIKALQALTPGAEWVIRGDEVYSNLEWLDTEQTKPTEEEIVLKQAELKYDYQLKEYQRKRIREYPSYADQFDKIFHSGIDVWKADIKIIKDKYPKQTIDATELQKRKDAAIFNLQKKDYEKAVARLAQYELSAGVKNEDGSYKIEPLPITVEDEIDIYVRNPLIVQDEKEREAAQQVVNKTPQAVIDSINT